jgi:hypothetical protein
MLLFLFCFDFLMFFKTLCLHAVKIATSAATNDIPARKLCQRCKKNKATKKMAVTTDGESKQSQKFSLLFSRFIDVCCSEQVLKVCGDCAANIAAQASVIEYCLSLLLCDDCYVKL